MKTGASAATVFRILRRQLRFYPYKLQLTQRLHRGDKIKRLRFCRWLLGKSSLDGASFLLPAEFLPLLKHFYLFKWGS